MDLIVISFLFAFAQIVVELIMQVIATRTLKFFDFFSWKTMILDFLFRWLVLYVFYAIIYFVIGFQVVDMFGNIIVFTSIFIGVVLVSIYGYALKPIIIFRDKKLSRSTNHEKTYQDILFGNKIYIHTKNFNNAYAIGILKFAKGVILSNELVEKMSPDELKGIIAHEVGHLKRNHIFKLYLAFVVAIAIGYFCSVYVFPITFAKLPIHEAFQHAIKGGIFYGVPIWIISSLTQRVLEYEADAYAGTLAGKEHIIAALNKLDEMSGGKVSQGNLAYPTLEQRIANILKS